MVDHGSLITLFSLIAIASPLVLLCLLGVASLIDHPISEQATARACQLTTLTGLVASILVLVLMLLFGERHETLSLGEWIVIPGIYHFSVKIIFDRLSVPLAILSFVLCGTVSVFATRYLHRERGYNRFFTLYALFVVGMVLTSLAGTIETLFAGWELVGLSSALLVAFFQERPAPVRNGLRVWVVYRVSDAALLLAAIVMHHITGEGDFDRLLGSGPWPEGIAVVTAGQALTVGLLLLVAAAGKSALVPFSGWLPRAMEGPTPSSAIFYGALSVHLGAFLLLRISPLLNLSPLLCTAIVILGLTTSLYAYLVGSVQTDIKTILSFASLVQVGLIVAEIGLGFRYLALIHLIGNACLRTLQFIRAPSLLRDYHLLENAIGEHLPQSEGPFIRLLPLSARLWLYRFALERGYLDSLLNSYVVAPFTALFGRFEALEERWTRFLAGPSARERDRVDLHSRAIEDLP